jgi:hypothetical protein
MWDHDKIRKNVERYIPKDPEAMREAFLDLLVAVYPFQGVLGATEGEPNGHTVFSSKLFPAEFNDDNDDLSVYNREERSGFVSHPRSTPNWFDLDYAEQDSIIIENEEGKKFPDTFSILYAVSSVSTASVSHGSITMRDIRHLLAWFQKHSTESVPDGE